MNITKLKRAINDEIEYRKGVAVILYQKFDTNLKQQLMNKINKDTPIEPYNNIKDTIAKLVVMLYKKIKYAISINTEDADPESIYYDIRKFVPKRGDDTILYNLVFILFKRYPSKNYTINKFKISRNYKYFIYKITYKKNNIVKYLFFDYNMEDRAGAPGIDLNIYIFFNLEDVENYIRYLMKPYHEDDYLEREVNFNKSQSQYLSLTSPPNLTPNYSSTPPKSSKSNYSTNSVTSKSRSS